MKTNSEIAEDIWQKWANRGYTGASHEEVVKNAILEALTQARAEWEKETFHTGFQAYKNNLIKQALAEVKKEWEEEHKKCSMVSPDGKADVKDYVEKEPISDENIRWNAWLSMEKLWGVNHYGINSHQLCIDHMIYEAIKESKEKTKSEWEEEQCHRIHVTGKDLERIQQEALAEAKKEWEGEVHDEMLQKMSYDYLRECEQRAVAEAKKEWEKEHEWKKPIICENREFHNDGINWLICEACERKHINEAVDKALADLKTEYEERPCWHTAYVMKKVNEAIEITRADRNKQIKEMIERICKKECYCITTEPDCQVCQVHDFIMLELNLTEKKEESE